MRWPEGHNVQPKVAAIWIKRVNGLGATATTESYHIHVLQLTNEELSRKEAWGLFLKSPDN